MPITTFDNQGNGYTVYDQFGERVSSTSSVANVVEEYICGETISGEMAVMLVGGKVFKFDPSLEANYSRCVGLSTMAGILGDRIKVLALGQISFGTGVLVADTVYYASVLGTLTNIVPATGIILEVGVAIDTDIMEINIKQPIVLI